MIGSRRASSKFVGQSSLDVDIREDGAHAGGYKNLLCM